MTITLSKEELQEFQEKLVIWHKEQMIFVLSNLHLGPDLGLGGSGNIKEQVHNLIDKYEKDHPRPDWRSLL